MIEIPKSVMLELRRELRALPAKKRIDRILERKDAMRVVRSLPVHDLYATIRDVGIEDSLELLELTSAKQVQAFLDLDGWRGDRIDGGAMATWLRALMAANADRAVGQIRGLDLELITLLFKLHCHVYDLAAEEEPAEDDVGMHSITPDQRYLIVYGGVGDDENMNGVLKEAIDRMCGRDMMFVLRLCEALRWELPSALEEESFRWRNARLADLGFLPRHEALEVLAWRDPDAPIDGERPATVKPTIHDEDALSTDLSTSVVFPWDALKDGAAAFAQAARDLDDEGRERVAHEVMLTANRVHAAEGGDAGDPEAVRGTARQVIDTVGVALSYRAQGDPARLGPLLATTPGVTLFRVGHSLSLKLQRELRSRVEARDSGLQGHGLLRLDSPLREVAAGLLRPRPLLFCGLLDAKRLDFRPPSSLVELAALGRAIAEIGFRGALLGPRGFGLDDDKLAAMGEADPAEQPGHGGILGAMLVRTLALGADAPIESIVGPADEATLAAARKVIDDPAARTKAFDVLATKARTFAPLPGANTAEDVDKRVRAYAAQVLDAISTELRFVDDDPDQRFVTTVWMKRGERSSD